MDNQSFSDPNSILDAPVVATDVIRLKQEWDSSDHTSPGTQSTVDKAMRIFSSPDRGSLPLFAIDRFAFKSDRKAKLISLAIHTLGITLVLVLAIGLHTQIMQKRALVVMPVSLAITSPVVPVMVAKPAMSGGGSRHLPAVKQERLPRIARVHLAQSRISRSNTLTHESAPATSVTIPDSGILPELGSNNPVQISLASQGGGSGSLSRYGRGGGIGASQGGGVGSGSSNGYGGGVMRVGGGVSAPQLVHSVEPEFTEQARRADYQGDISIQLIVDSQGHPQDVRAITHLAMGLEAKAINAVKQYRFRPAIYQGHAVSVYIVIDVSFHLH